MPNTNHSDPDGENARPGLTSSEALPAPLKIAFPAGTKAGSEVTLVTATPAQSQLTGTPNSIPIEAVGTTFDYEVLATEIAGGLRNYAARIRKEVSETAHSNILIGHFLTLAKQVLAHGQFIRWVRAEFGFSLGSAENYMRVCEFTAHDNRFVTVRILPLTTLYLISAKNAPPEVVEAVLARAKRGEPVPAAEVKRLVREFKHRSREETQSNRRCERTSYERGQVQNEIARANAQLIIEQFGRDGAALLVGMRQDLPETLSYLEQAINASDGRDSSR